MSLREIGEFGLIEKIKAVVAAPAQDLVLGIDDDAAVVATAEGDRYVLLSCDALHEGVHFDLRYFSFFDVGWRLAAANLSDVAAMCGEPRWALVTASLPDPLAVADVEECFRGMRALCDRYATFLVGGDLAASPDRLCLSMFVLGEVERDRLVTRAGARVGDAVFVTGNLGAAQAGLRLLQAGRSGDDFQGCVEKHRRPQPRVAEARFLAEACELHAMIDVSDGLAGDLAHICRLSRVGAVVYEEALPIDRETRAVAEEFGDSTLDYALHGGEDFELLFTAPATCEVAQRFQERFELPCTCVGEIVSAAEGLTLQTRSGKRVPLRAQGYEHFQP